MRARVRSGKSAVVTDEWQIVQAELRATGIAGVDDFGRFVNNTKYFEPARFDSVAARSTLLRLLPTLTQPRVVATVGRHLQQAPLRQVDGAFETVKDVYLRWAREPGEAGWVLGDTLCKAADKTRGPELLELAERDAGGMSRGCIVEALWRFKSTVDVEPALRRLVSKPEVVYPALSSLQRTVGADAMTPVWSSSLPSRANLRSRRLRRDNSSGYVARRSSAEL